MPGTESGDPSRRLLLMLEDESERIERFTTVLRNLAPELELHVWGNAWQLIAEVDALLPHARLISLDHDLFPTAEQPEDPGDGWMVVKHLVGQAVVRPVIIHTSNRERSTWMEGEFELAGWRYRRVAPLGNDWIEVDWRYAVQRILRGKSRRGKR